MGLTKGPKRRAASVKCDSGGGDEPVVAAMARDLAAALASVVLLTGHIGSGTGHMAQGTRHMAQGLGAWAQGLDTARPECKGRAVLTPS